MDGAQASRKLSAGYFICDKSMERGTIDEPWSEPWVVSSRRYRCVMNLDLFGDRQVVREMTFGKREDKKSVKIDKI